MIAASDQRSPCGTAQSSGVETVVAQAFRSEPVHGWRRNASTERAKLAETAVIDQDEQDIWRSAWGLDRLRKLRGIGVEISASNLAAEMEVRSGEYVRCAPLNVAEV